MINSIKIVIASFERPIENHNSGLGSQSKRDRLHEKMLAVRGVDAGSWRESFIGCLGRYF